MKRKFLVTIESDRIARDAEQADILANYICDAVVSWYGGGDPSGVEWYTMENAQTVSVSYTFEKQRYTIEWKRKK